MKINLTPDWNVLLKEEMEQPYFLELLDFVFKEYDTFPNQIFPPHDQIFAALNACKLEDVKVVILGQDPYPTRGHANGLCFSLNPSVYPLAKSLINVFKEVMSDEGIDAPDNGDLTRWANQGVLLLNDVLTVKEGLAGSHQRKGWEHFTKKVIELVNKKKTPVVFFLWGGHAHKKEKWITNESHLILKSGHPSPLSANQGKWFGNRHFSTANTFLISKGLEPINW